MNFRLVNNVASSKLGIGILGVVVVSIIIDM